MQICQGIGLNLVKCLTKLSFKWKFLVNFLVHQFGLVCYCKTNVGLQPMSTLNQSPSTWLCRWWSHLNSCRASTVWSWAIKMRRFPQRENVWSSTMLNVRWYVLFSEKRVDFQKTELFLVNKKINLRNSRLVVQGFFWVFPLEHETICEGSQFNQGHNSPTNFHNPQHLDDPRLKIVPDIHGLKMVHKHLELFSFLFIEFLDKMLKNTVSRDGARL